MAVGISLVRLWDPMAGPATAQPPGEMVRLQSANPKESGSKHGSIECSLLLYHRKVNKLSVQAIV